MYSMKRFICSKCGRELANRHSLSRHRKKCRSKVPSTGSESLPGLRLATSCKAPRCRDAYEKKPRDEAILANIPVLERPTPETKVPTPRSNNSESLKDLIDNIVNRSYGDGLFLRHGGTIDSALTAASSEEDDDDESDIEEVDDEKVGKAFLKMLNSKIKKQKGKMKRLIKSLEDDEDEAADLLELVNTYLLTYEEEVLKDAKDMLQSMKMSSKSIEIGMLLDQIEKEKSRLDIILYRLKDISPLEVQAELEQMVRGDIINEDVMKSLTNSSLKPLDIINILKEEKVGAGIVTQYLPSSLNELLEKLKVLVGEHISGNSSVRDQIAAILKQLYQMEEITIKEYKDTCNNFGCHPDY